MTELENCQLTKNCIVQFGTSGDGNNSLLFLFFCTRKLTSKYNRGIGTVMTSLWISKQMKYGEAI